MLGGRTLSSYVPPRYYQAGRYSHRRRNLYSVSGLPRTKVGSGDSEMITVDWEMAE